MIFIILKFKNLNRSIVFSICFIYIFNLSSIVYANHKVKDERIIGVGTLVSTGLAFLAKAEVVAVLSALALRFGLDMNYTNQSAVEKFIEENPNLINSENLGKSENGLIAVSKNLINKFSDFLKNIFTENQVDVVPSSAVSYNFPKSNLENFTGMIIPVIPNTQVKYFSDWDFVPENFLKAELYYNSYMSSLLLVYKFKDHERSYIVAQEGQGGTLIFYPSYDYGTYIPSNELKDDKNNVYTGNGDFILNPSWDIGSNAGALEGFPSLPWEGKEFGSVGNVGVLNPDGTITVPDSIPDVENPDVPDTDIDSNTGILGWLTSFWENLWNFCMDLVKKLFYPQKAIDAWTNLNSMIWDKFRFLGQLNGIKWTTNNNQRLRIPFTYNNRTYIIQLPDSFEENNVTYFRNIFKYFVYAITLFVCVRILRPRFTIGTR